MVGYLGTTSHLYGLDDVEITIESVDDAGIGAIAGTGTWQGQTVNFQGQLHLEDSVYVLRDVTGNLDLSPLLGNSPHFTSYNNGQVTLSTAGDQPQFAFENWVEVSLDPDSSRGRSPFFAKLSDFVSDDQGIVSFSITPQDLTQPLEINLAEGELELASQPLTYQRLEDGAYSLTLPAQGFLRLPQADPLNIDGTIVYGGKTTGDHGVTTPTQATLEIVNTNPLNVAGTQFYDIGGLTLNYREDQQRRNGIFAISGDNSIKVEVLSDVEIQLGNEDFDLGAAVQSADSSLLKPSQWILGALDEKQVAALEADNPQFNLGLAIIDAIDIQTPTFLNRSPISGTGEAADPELQLVELLKDAGLFRISPLYPTLQDRFTILGLDGEPISEVVIDISAVDEGQGSNTVSRQQQLSKTEKFELFAIQKLEEAGEDTTDLDLSGAYDVWLDSEIPEEFANYTEYFEAQTLSTEYGTVTIDAEGNWSYTLDPSKVTEGEGDRLENANHFQVNPRANIGSEITASLKDVAVSLDNIMLGVKDQAKTSLEALDVLVKVVDVLETEIPLTGLPALDNLILGLLQAVPANPYRDDKLQIIEVLDSIIYTRLSPKLKKKTDGRFSTVSIAPIFKSLSNVFGVLKILAAIPPEGTSNIDQIDLDLLFRSDFGTDDPYRWLETAFGRYEETAGSFEGALADLAEETEEEFFGETKREKVFQLFAKDLEDDEEGDAKGDEPDPPEGNKTIRGKWETSTEVTFNLEFDIPPIYEPIQFITDFLVEDAVNLFSLDTGFELTLEVAPENLPQLAPMLSLLIGLEAELKVNFNLLSFVSSDDLARLGAQANAIANDFSLNLDDQKAQVSSLVSALMGDSFGTDLSKNALEVGIKPYLGLQLGTDNYNVAATVGVKLGYEMTSERQVDGVAPDDQRIYFSDYYSDQVSAGIFSYAPTLGSLRLDLDHNYDFLLARNSADTERFGSFEEAYGENSWLLNLQIEPLNLGDLIGNSQISYDITLLEKLGDRAIDRIDWISIAGSSLVTSQGVDLFFEDAKFLNSAASNALRNALARQYPELTPQELGRLLSLIVDYGLPNRISYALADAEDVETRIDEMQSVYTIKSARDLDSPIAPTDRFRFRYEEGNDEAAIDSYQYYSLGSPKYVSINPELTTNYAAIEFDLISEGTDIELDLHFFDGSRWQLLGKINDVLDRDIQLKDTFDPNPSIQIADENVQGIALAYKRLAETDPDRYVQNQGTVTLQLSLAHMDRPDATANEKLIAQLASQGKLQLRLSDSATSNPQVTFTGAPRIERGGAIYVNSSGEGAQIRQHATQPWAGNLDAGVVQWISPAFLSTSVANPGLDFFYFTKESLGERSDRFRQQLNPHAPLGVQLALHQLEERDSTHISGGQGGSLANAVEGVMRFTHDPITNTAYKSYIGADGVVRIAVRTFDGQDWIDIATLDDLTLKAGETHAPDLVAIDGQVVVASWNSAGVLVTYTILPDPVEGRIAITRGLPNTVTLDPYSVTGGEENGNQIESATSAGISNGDLHIGLEKRLDLSSGSTSLQKAYYLSLLDPIQQVYATSSQAVDLDISGYGLGLTTHTLEEASQNWANEATGNFSQETLMGQAMALLGFGEKSQMGTFSGAQADMTPGQVKGAEFMEFASGSQLQAHLAEWGSGSVFVVVGNDDGSAMVWNFDGDAYYRNNGDRNAPESVLSSGRVYNLDGVIPDGLSVVYKPVDQKDVLVSNWDGLVDARYGDDYRQVPGTTLRNADRHTLDDLVAGGNVALLVTGTAQGLNQQIQRTYENSDLGVDDGGAYDYEDGTQILRYFSTERVADDNGVYYWFDANNVAPLQLRRYEGAGTDSAQQATAALNSGTNQGGLGWMWTIANPNDRKYLELANLDSGLGFVDSNSLNLAIASDAWSQTHGTADMVTVLSDSLQLLPSKQTPELFFASAGANGTQHVSLGAGALTEVGMVLHGAEMLNPWQLTGDRALTAANAIQSFFDGSRPFISRGGYVPLAYYRDGNQIFYGDLNAPVALPSDLRLPQNFFDGLEVNAVNPLGFEGTVSDYISYGVRPEYSEDLLELIRQMPVQVGDDYFQFMDHDSNPIDIGTVIHAPMVPLFDNDKSNDRARAALKLDLASQSTFDIVFQAFKEFHSGNITADALLAAGFRDRTIRALEGRIEDQQTRLNDWLGVTEQRIEEQLSSLAYWINISPSYYLEQSKDSVTENLRGLILDTRLPDKPAGQIIFDDLTPWSPDQAALYVEGLQDISLGRGEPDAVILEQMRLVGTYTEAAQNLQTFVDHAWNDSILKYNLLDEALPVNGFNNAEDWLQEFRSIYSDLEVPQSIEFVNANYPTLLNNTMFSPVVRDGVISDFLPLPYTGPTTQDVLLLNHAFSAGLELSVDYTAWPLSGNIFSLEQPFMVPYTVSTVITSVTGGPLVGDFEVLLDENRNLVGDRSELSKEISQAFYQFDISSRLNQILLDTSDAANQVWTGEGYELVFQNGIPDFRSGLVITRALGENTVVDVMTGLSNQSTYISRADLSIADTHWESVKNSALLDYIPLSFSNVTAVASSRWFDTDPITNRSALTRLVPIALEEAFKASFQLPSAMAEEFDSVTRVYDALARAYEDPTQAPADLLAQYSFENRVMLVTGLIKRLYDGLAIATDQLGSPNQPNGYGTEIYAYQVLPYLALTLQGKTDSYYRDLLNLIAEGVGTPEYATAVASDGYQIDLSNPLDLALVLGFARLTMPHTDLGGGFTFTNGRLDFSGSRDIDLKGVIQTMGLSSVANTMDGYMDAFDRIASQQYDVDSRLVTTAVSPIKTSLLETNGILDQAATAILDGVFAHDLPAPPDTTTIDPITPEQFTAINRSILERSTTTNVTPGVAGLSKATTVEQAFGQEDTSKYEFTLRLSEPAPSGGAVFLLNYEGAARYGIDYTIEGYDTQPRYLHVAAGETSARVTIDVSGALYPSSLLIQLASASANYEVSRSFNRLLLEIDGDINGGSATLREQVDNVQVFTLGGVTQLVGENLYDGIPENFQALERRTIGTQAGLHEPHVMVSRYVSSFDPTIARFSTTPPDDADISGHWILTGTELFRAYEGNQGLVDVVELRNPVNGQFTYAVEPSAIESLVAQGWVTQGVVFSLDLDRSLPIAIDSNPEKTFDLQVPGFDLSGAHGYFDRYIYGENQDISEWRFLAEIENLDFVLGDRSFSLGGALSLRQREEYGDSTFWLDANVDHFALPSFGETTNGEPIMLNDGRLSFRIVDPQDTDTVIPAAIDQWQVTGEVNNLPVFDWLLLNGSLDARYENSIATDYQDTYWLSATVNDFDFSTEYFVLEDLEAEITDLTIVDGGVTAWTLDSQVQNLALGEWFTISGALHLTYGTDPLTNSTTFRGQADIGEFNVNLEGNSVVIDNGSIAFNLVDGHLQSWDLMANVENLHLDGLLNLSGAAAIAYAENDEGTTVIGNISLLNSTFQVTEEQSLTFTSGNLNFETLDGALQQFNAQAQIENADFGLFSIVTAIAGIEYSELAKDDGTTTERLNLSLTDADLAIDLGGAIPSQLLADVNLNLTMENGELLSYDLAADSVLLDLGNGITVAGDFNLVHETLRDQDGDSTQTFGAFAANSISVDLPDLAFDANGYVDFSLEDNALSQLSIFAQVDDLTLAGVNINGFLDLRLSDFEGGAPGQIIISGGVQDISLPESSTVLNGEVKELTLVAERNGEGVLTGQYNPIAWELFGSVEDFSIGGLFNANGYARLAYKEESDRKNLSGKVEVNEFTLNLPGGELQGASINGSAAFDLDYIDQGDGTTATDLNWFELTGGVTNLNLAEGVTISGDISLEYQDADYGSNPFDQSRFILNASLQNSQFLIGENLSLDLAEGRLNDFTITSDGVVQSWELTTKVDNLNFFGLFNLSGDFNLDFARNSVDGSTTFNGSAIVDNFAIDFNGDGENELDNLSGAFSFTQEDGRLAAWSLSTPASGFTLFDSFHIDRNFSIDAVLSEDGEADNIYTINATANHFLDLGNGASATLNGQLRDLVIVQDPSFMLFGNQIQSWTFEATEVALELENFSINGSATIDYERNPDNVEVFTIAAEVDDFRFPANLSSVPNLTGSLNATFVDPNEYLLDFVDSPELTDWELTTTVNNFDFVGLDLTGAMKIRYSETDEEQPFYEVNSSFQDLTINLPNGQPLVLETGNIDFRLVEDGYLVEFVELFPLRQLDAFRIQTTVSAFAIAPNISVSGAIDIAYEDDLYRFSGTIEGLALPTGAPGQTFGGTLKDLVLSSDGEVHSWEVSAFLEDFSLFGDTTFSGSADISYRQDNGQDVYELTAMVDSFALDGPNLDLDLSGSIDLAIVDGEVTRWSLNTQLDGLDVLEFSLTGDLNLDYDLRSPLYFNRETLEVERAMISADLLDGLVSADLELRDLILTNGDGWEPWSWQATADISLGHQSEQRSPFTLSGNLGIAYQHENPTYGQLPTYTLNGAIDTFSFTDPFLSVGDANLILDELVLADGVVRSVDFSGAVDDFRIDDFLGLSGSFDLDYFTNGGTGDEGTWEFMGVLDDLQMNLDGQYQSLFDWLGISTGSIEATRQGEDLQFLANVVFEAGSEFAIGDFQFGIEEAEATIRYGYEPGMLELDVGGRLSLGTDNPFPVEGNFSVDFDLNNGLLPTLDTVTLNLTPDNTPANFGLVELQPGSMLSYSDNEISLTTDLRVNTGFLDAVASPVYDFIDTISPAIDPVVNILETTIPTKDLVTEWVGFTIPGFYIPEVYISRWERRWWGGWPVFDVRWIEIIPPKTVEILPSFDIGSLLVNYFEDYAGNPYAGNGTLEVIEVIDKLGSVIFKSNQTLARLGVEGVFDSYVSMYGDQAYSMEYPTLAPFVKTVGSLLALAEDGQSVTEGDWLDLDPISFSYNLDSGEFNGSAGNIGETLLNSLDGFGDLYRLVNQNPSINENLPEPQGDIISGFVDQSSFSVPILDNLPKVLLDFVLDKNIDLFSYNLDLAAGFQGRAEANIPLIIFGVPVPITLGGDLGFGAALDATLGYSAPTSEIKAIAEGLGELFTGGDAGIDSVMSLLFNAATAPNSGAYLELDDQMLRLDASMSVDAGVDYGVFGLRGQLGLATSLFGGLSLEGADQEYERLYFNNLLRSIFDPEFQATGDPAELLLGLQLGNSKIWTDFQAKLASPWTSLFRLEGQLPLPNIGWEIPLGTIYTGPTFGSAEVIFDLDFNFDLSDGEAQVFSDLRNGTADQGDLFSRISEKVLDDDLSGLLVVRPSADARDVMTGISRNLALFDHISPSDRIPDALTVISSLQSLPALFQHHDNGTGESEDVDETYLYGITGFESLSISTNSSYLGLTDDSTRDNALAQLQMEYRLQALLLATQDYLAHFGIDRLNLQDHYPTLPQGEGLLPYLPLFLYGQSQTNPGEFLTLDDGDSLGDYFRFVNQLILESTTDSTADLTTALTAAAPFMGNLLGALNQEITAIASDTANLPTPHQAPALALVGLKEQMQSGIFGQYLHSLAADTATADQLQILFNEGLQRPGASQNQLTFAEATWAIDANNNDQIQLKLSHPSHDLGASLSVLIDSELIYGEHYRINGLEELPTTLAIAPGEDTLNLELEWLSGFTGGMKLILLQGHSGIQIDGNGNTLAIDHNGTAMVESTELSVAGDLSGLMNVDLIQGDDNGVFWVPNTNDFPPLLVGFDPLQGHTVQWQFGSSDTNLALRIINGVLYNGDRPWGHVLSPVAGDGSWEPLAYVGSDVISGTSTVAIESAELVTLAEDGSLTVGFAELLDRTGFTVVAGTGGGNVALSYDGNGASDRLTITPQADFNGQETIFLTLDDGTQWYTVKVPILVTPVDDAPRALYPLTLSTDEDTALTFDITELTTAFLDPDRLDLVEFVKLEEKTTAGEEPLTITEDGTQQQITITPPENAFGDRQLILTVASASGEHTFEIPLTINAVDDLPSSGNDDATLISGSTPVSITTAHLQLVDIDGPNFDPNRDGIRITAYPFAGALLWKETPSATATPFDPVAHPLVTLAQLDAGQLLYQGNPDNVWSQDNGGKLVTDYFQYVIVQTGDESTIISNPQTFVLADPTPGNGDDDTLPPLPPAISSYEVIADDTGLTFTFTFDQAVRFEGGPIRLYLVENPEQDDPWKAIAEIATDDPAVTLAEDGLSLSVHIATDEEDHLLDQEQGYFMVDLMTQGDVLQNSNDLSLVGTPLLYGTSVDFKTPELLDHTFVNTDSALVLQLNFSEEVVSLGNVHLESVHPITGQTQLITEQLQPSTTVTEGQTRDGASREMFVDLSALVDDLQLMPGQRYTVVLDEETGVSDRTGHGDSYRYEFELPFPNSSLFTAAQDNVLAVPESPYHLYFSLDDAAGEAIPLTVMGLGEPDPILATAESFSLSNHGGLLETDGVNTLGINLYGEDVEALLAKAETIEFTLRYDRSEVWIDRYQLEGANLTSWQMAAVDGDPDGEKIDLTLRFERGAGWTLTPSSDGNGVQLANVPLLAIPNDSAPNLQDSFPSVLITMSAVATTDGSPAPDISLPELVLQKSNDFSKDLFLLTSTEDLTVTQNATEPITALVEVRNVNDLDSDGQLTVSVQPTKGQVTLNAEGTQWSYIPNADAIGEDSFTLSIRDINGNTAEQTIQLVIEGEANTFTTENENILDGQLSGSAQDGPIAGGTVFLDVNRNKIHDEDEPSTFTDGAGRYDLNIPDRFDVNNNGAIDPEEGRLVITGGTDIVSGKPLANPLSALADGTVITPLTTLINELVDQGLTPQGAETQVKTALNLPSTLNLNTYDPITALQQGDPNAKAVLASQVAVQNLIILTTTAVQSVSPNTSAQTVGNTFTTQLTQLINNGNTLNLSSTTQIQSLVQNVLQDLGSNNSGSPLGNLANNADNLAQLLGELNDSILTANDLTTIFKAQKVGQTQTSDELTQVVKNNQGWSTLLANNSGNNLWERIQAASLNINVLTPGALTQYTMFDDGLSRDSLGSLIYNSGNATQAGVDDLALQRTKALFHNIIGLYKLQDALGGVLDTVDANGDGSTTDILHPGDRGYMRAALSNRVENFVLQLGAEGHGAKNTSSAEFGDVLLQGGTLYAPFIIANGGRFIPAGGSINDGINAFLARNPNNVGANGSNFLSHSVSYFSFSQANPDRSDHLKSFGNGIFGFEDLPGNLGVSDFDFDDAVFRFNFSK